MGCLEIRRHLTAARGLSVSLDVVVLGVRVGVGAPVDKWAWDVIVIVVIVEAIVSLPVAIAGPVRVIGSIRHDILPS
jgi:hypothetical protein